VDAAVMVIAAGKGIGANTQAVQRVAVVAPISLS